MHQIALKNCQKHINKPLLDLSQQFIESYLNGLITQLLQQDMHT